MMHKGLNHRKSERGQAFTELAISLVFLLMLLSAVVDLGWAFYTLIALRDMAQEGASYGSLYPCEKVGTQYGINSAIQARVLASATAPLTPDDPNIVLDDGVTPGIVVEIIDKSTNAPATLTSIQSGAAFDYGNSVRVTVTYQHHIVTPFLGTFIGNNWKYPLSVNVSDTILQIKTKSGAKCR